MQNTAPVAYWADADINMVRNYVRKTARGLYDPQLLKSAVEHVLAGHSLRASANKFGVGRATLGRHLKEAESKGGTGYMEFKYGYGLNTVFSESEERELAENLSVVSRHQYGLTSYSIRLLAFQMAKEKKKQQIPSSWQRDSLAGIDWLERFMERHPELALNKRGLTTPHETEIFGRANIVKFFDDLESITEKFHFGPQDIYCVHEAELTAINRQDAIQNGDTLLGSTTTHLEQETSITICSAANAIGNSVPPFLVFPREYHKNLILKGAPPGTMMSIDARGQMTAVNFVLWLRHFIKVTRCSKSCSVLLIMDNHKSHLSTESIKLANENGIIFLTLPPQYSNFLQPLHRTMHGPLKTYYNAACKNWKTENPESTMTVYNVAENLGEVFPDAFTPNNILSGFRETGIFPINRSSTKFLHCDFLMSFKTDQPSVKSENNQLSITNGSYCNNGHSSEQHALLHMFPPLKVKLENNDTEPWMQSVDIKEEGSSIQSMISEF